MTFYKKSKKHLWINIVSMVDILAILLIFFIATTTFKKVEPKVEIKLPESATAEEKDKPDEPTIVYVTKDSKVFVDKDEVAIESLANELRKRKGENPKRLFAMKADTDISLGFFVKVLDASREAGLDNLSLFTEPVHKQP